MIAPATRLIAEVLGAIRPAGDPSHPLLLTHFQSFLLFAAVISVAFGYLGRRQPAHRIRYIFWCFFLFLVVGIGIGWAMYPFSR